MKKNHITYILIIILFGCTDTKENKFSNNNNIEKILQRMEITKFDLDDINSDTLLPSVIIDDKFIKGVEKEIFLAFPTSCLFQDNRYFISDRILNTIIEIDSSGNFISKIGRRGKAPKEFIEPFSIKSNRKYIFVQDVGNGRIQIFDKDFTYINSIEAAFMPFVQDFSLNLKMLLVPTEMYTFYDVYNINKINYHQMEEDTTYTFPPIFNTNNPKYNSMLSLNALFVSENIICFYYHSLPYIFFTNIQQSIFHGIKLVSKQISDLEKNLIDQEQGGTAMIITDVEKLGDNHIVVASNQYLLIFNISLTESYLEKLFMVPKEFAVSSIDISEKHLFTFEWSKSRVLRFDISF